MSKTLKFIGFVILGLAFFLSLVVFSSSAKAADGTFDQLNVRNRANFYRFYDGWIGTGSEIYDNNDLVIASDDNIDLWAPQKVLFRSDAYWRRNYDGWDGTQSRIYDNNDMHVSTDDFLYLDAPVKTIVQNHMDVNGTLQVYGLLVSHGTVDFSGAGSVIFPSIVLFGDVDMNGHNINNVNNLDIQGVIANDNPGGYVTIADGLDVQGNLWNSTSSLNINDNLVVTGTSDLRGQIFNTTGDVVINDVTDFQNSVWSSVGSFTVSDSMTVDNLAYLNGGINVNGGNFTVDTLGNTIVKGYLDVRGDLFDGAGPLTINDILVQAGSSNQVTFNGNVDALNGLDVTGNLVVTGTSDLRDDIFNSTGSVEINDVLIVYNTTTINGTLYTRDIYPILDNNYDIGLYNTRYQDGYFSGALYVGSTTGTYTQLHSNGLQNYGSNMFLDSDNSITMWPTGAVYLIPDAGTSYSRHFYPYNDLASGSYDLGANGQEWRNLYLANYLNLNDNFTVDSSGNTYVNGTAELESTLDVDGWADFDSGISVDGNTYLNSALDVDGFADFDNGMSVANTAYFQSGIDVDGISYFDNHVLPGADSSYNFGSPDYAWLNGYFDNLYASTNLNVGSGNFTVDASGNTYVNGTAELESTLDVDGFADFDNGMSVANTAYFQSSIDVDGIGYFDNDVYANNIYPNDDSNYDIGASGNEWEYGYFNNLYVGDYSGSNVYITPGLIFSYISDLTVNGDADVYVRGTNLFLFPDSALTHSYSIVPDGTGYYLGDATHVWDYGYFADLYVTDSFDVGGGNFTVDSSGNTYAAGTLEVDGQADFDGNVDANSGLDVTGANLTVGGGNFFVDPTTGNATSLGIVTAATLTDGTLTISVGDLSTTGNLTAGGTVSAGNITDSGNLLIQGFIYNPGPSDVQVNDSFQVTGASDFQGIISSSAGDLLFADSLVPTLNSNYDLGSPSYEWANGYIDNVYAYNLLPKLLGPSKIGSPDAEWDEAWVDTVNTFLLMPKDASSDVGAVLTPFDYGYFNDLEAAGGYGAGIGTGTTVDANINSNGNIHADGTLSSGATITINGNTGTDSIVSTHGMTIDAATIAGLNLNTTNNRAISTGTGLITLNGNVDATNGIDITNAPLTMGSQDITGVGANITAAGGLTISSAAATNITLNSGTTGQIFIGATGNNKTINVQTGTGGTINVGNNGNNKTIHIGGSTNDSSDTIDIATDGTTADTILIGNANAATTLGLTGGTSWSITTGGAATFTGNALANIFRASDGTVGTPGFSFTGDTDTGMYHPGANTLAFSTNGTNALTIGSAGLVTLADSMAFSSTTPGISIGNTGTLTITDGTNTLMSLADVGTTGNLVITGTSDFQGSIASSTGALTIADVLSQTGAVNQVTFSGNVDAQNGLDVTSAALTFNNALTQTGASQVTFTGNVDAQAGLDITNAALTMGSQNITGVGTNITAAGALTIQSTAAALTLDTSAANTINIGNTNASAIALGNAGAVTTITQTGAGQVAFNGNVNANLGLDVSGAAFTFTGTAGSWNMALLDSALTQTGTGLVTLTGNVDATNGLDVTGANLTASTGEFAVTNGTGSVTINDDGNLGQVSVEGSILDIDSLGFVGAGTITSGATTLTLDATTTIELVDNVNATAGLDITNAALTMGSQNITGVGTNITAAGALTIQSTAAALTLDTSAANTINIGNTNASAIALGNAGAVTTITQTGAGQVAFNGNVNANLGLDVSGAAFTFTGTAGSWNMALLDSALTQTGTGLVTLTGNVDATNGLDVTGALTVTTTIDVDGTANIADTTAGSDVTMGNSTGNLTFASDNADFTLTDATDNVFQLVNSAGGNPLFDIDLGATDTITMGNNLINIALDSSVWDIDAAGVASGFTGITSSGNIDFSGATTMKMPVLGAAPACAAPADRGSFYFNTTNGYAYVCTDDADHSGGGGDYAWQPMN